MPYNDKLTTDFFQHRRTHFSGKGATVLEVAVLGGEQKSAILNSLLDR